MKKILAIGLLIFLVGYAVWSFVSPKEPKVAAELGSKAPDFELETLDGKTVNLSDFEGKKVFLNFWGTWCGPCKEEMPDMEKIHKTYGNDVVILAVNKTSREKNLNTVNQFIHKYNLTFPIALDKEDNVNTQYEVIGLPTSYFIDEKGIITNVRIGGVSYEQMELFVKE
ncbi:redoxin domain-containing protein [Metabacillus fastidiosus]|uniref:redoxin domain-containing protein n=1 Tax=Metabacillus fastidiosus TaxID=1458 RepID=UPI003D276657